MDVSWLSFATVGNFVGPNIFPCEKKNTLPIKSVRLVLPLGPLREISWNILSLTSQMTATNDYPGSPY